MIKLDNSQFDWQSWRAGSPNDLNLICRESCLTSNRGKSIIREHAIGYCNAEDITCRPKKDNMAVMFLKNNKFFWFHLKNNEFKEIFGELK